MTSNPLIFEETSLLMKGPLVRATLGGRKTMTRRGITQRNSLIDGSAPTKKTWAELDWSKPDLIHADPGPSPSGNAGPYLKVPNIDGERWHRVYPRVQPGTKIWIKETGWERPVRTPRMMREGADTWAPFYYDADGLSEGDHEQFKAWGFKRRPSIHMPRFACRLNLEATKVRVERLNDISEADTIAEGVDRTNDCEMTYITRPGIMRKRFKKLWESINGPGSWAMNQWVWVYEYRRVKS